MHNIITAIIAITIIEIINIFLLLFVFIIKFDKQFETTFSNPQKPYAYENTSSYNN